MSTHKTNKFLALIGSLLAVNGGLLAVSPRRFAALRKSNMLPSQANAWLDGLARHSGTSRPVGLGLVALGLLLLAAGLFREPATD